MKSVLSNKFHNKTYYLTIFKIKFNHIFRLWLRSCTGLLFYCFVLFTLIFKIKFNHIFRLWLRSCTGLLFYCFVLFTLIIFDFLLLDLFVGDYSPLKESTGRDPVTRRKFFRTDGQNL